MLFFFFLIFVWGGGKSRLLYKLNNNTGLNIAQVTSKLTPYYRKEFVKQKNINMGKFKEKATRKKRRKKKSGQRRSLQD